MSGADITQPVPFDPLGEATRARAEVRMTGAQLMDLVEEAQRLRTAVMAAEMMHDALISQFSHHTLAGESVAAIVAFEKARDIALAVPVTEGGGDK